MNTETENPTQEDNSIAPNKVNGDEKPFFSIAIGYNILGLIVGFSIIFIRDVRTAAIFGMVYPLLAIIVIIFSKGNIKFLSETKKSKKWFTMLGFFLPTFTQLLNSLGKYDLLDYKNVWLPFLIVAVVVLLMLISTGLNYAIGGVIGQIIFMFIASLIYGFGFVIQVNCVFDQSHPTKADGELTAKHSQWGRSSENYYFAVNFVVDGKQITRSPEVSKSTYDQYQPGSHIIVNIKKGTLNIPWYYITK